MAPTPTPTLGPSGIDQFSPAKLLRTARLFASDPALPTLMRRNHGGSSSTPALNSRSGSCPGRQEHTTTGMTMASPSVLSRS